MNQEVQQETRARVFVPQQSMRKHRLTEEWVPVHNLGPALRFGDLVNLLPAGFTSLDSRPMVAMLRNRLRDFNDDDYILAMGSPTSIAATCMVASEFNEGRVKILQWDKRDLQYVVLPIDVLDEEEATEG